MADSGLQKLKYPEAAKVALAKILDEHIAEAEAFRTANWSEDHAVHQRMYECIPKTTSPVWPWRGASSLFFPLGRSATDAHVSQEHDALWTNDPFLKLSAIESNDLKEAELLSIYYGEFLYKKQVKMRTIGGDYTMNNAIDGTTVLIPTWNRSSRTRINYSVEQKPLYRTIEEEFLGLATKTRQIIGYEDIPKEEFIVESYDQPELSVGDVDKLFMSPETKNSLYAEECPWYYVESDWSVDQLTERYNRKRAGVPVYDFGSADDFAKLKGQVTNRQLTEKEKMKRQADGLSQTETGKSVRVQEHYMPLVLPGEYRVGDQITRQDWDTEDGHMLDCIVTYLPDQRVVCRIVPVGRIYPDGKRPHILSQWCRRHNHPYGMGVMARCRQMNKFINNMGNQMVDRGTLETLPFAFYNPSQTGLLPDMTGIAPGQYVPISGDPRGIFQPRMQSGSADFYNMAMNMGLEWNERDTTVNDFNLGRGRTTSTGTNTAKGQAMMMQAGRLMFSRLTSQHAEPLAEAYQRIHELHRRYAKDQIFTVTGAGAQQFQKLRVPQRAFQQDVSFEFIINPDRTWETQVAEKILQYFAQLPEVMNNPEGKRRLYENFYTAWGQKDFNRIYSIQAGMPPMQPGAEGQQPGAMPMQPQGMMQGLPGSTMTPPPALPGASNVVPFPQGGMVPNPSENEESVRMTG